MTHLPQKITEINNLDIKINLRICAHMLTNYQCFQHLFMWGRAQCKMVPGKQSYQNHYLLAKHHPYINVLAFFLTTRYYKRKNMDKIDVFSKIKQLSPSSNLISYKSEWSFF